MVKTSRKRAPKRPKFRGVHKFIGTTFAPQGGVRAIRTRTTTWRDGSNLQCGRAVATGLTDFVERGAGLKRIKSSTARAIISFLLAAGYKLVAVEAPVRCARLRVATRIDLVALRGSTAYVIEIKVSAFTAWSVRSTVEGLRHVEVPNTPCNRAWIQAVIGAVMYSKQLLNGGEDVWPSKVRARVLHVYPKPEGKGFMVRLVAEPKWVRERAFPFMIKRSA